jgi:hypothetical protein
MIIGHGLTSTASGNGDSVARKSAAQKRWTMEEKHKSWSFLRNAIVVVTGAAVAVAVVSHYREPPPTVGFMLFWFVFMIALGLLGQGTAWLARKLRRSTNEALTWEARNLPPNRNPYWRPPRSSNQTEKHPDG